MKLSELNFKVNPKNTLVVIKEGYLRTYDFDYQGNQVTDPRPKVVSLGRWRSNRGNNLMAGINLNYLSPEQISRLQQNAQRIVRDRNLQRRARTLRALMPDIFNTAYRTYYKDAVDNVEAGTLKFLSARHEKPPEDPKDMDAVRPDTAPTATTDADDVVAPRIREPEPEKEPEKEPEEPRIKQPERPERPEQPSDVGTDETEAEELEDEEEV